MDKTRIERVLARTREILNKARDEGFSEEVKIEAWNNAKGRCEICGKQLAWENHNEGERGAWEAHHIIPKSERGSNDRFNCQILCLDCHKKTQSYGKHD